VDYAMNVMIRHKISHLPVIEDKRIAAVVSIGDLIKELYDEDEIKIRYYGDYIGGTYKNEVF
jgi:CBS domain-containing protein